MNNNDIKNECSVRCAIVAKYYPCTTKNISKICVKQNNKKIVVKFMDGGRSLNNFKIAFEAWFRKFAPKSNISDYIWNALEDEYILADKREIGNDLTFSNKNVGDEEKNMKKDTEEKKKDQDYIIITMEGYTQTPNGMDKENMQVLWFGMADSKENALDKAKKEGALDGFMEFDVYKIDSEN